MDASTKASILHGRIGRMGAGGVDITTKDWLDFVEAQNDGYQTGPAIGEKVPNFALPDQNGRTWTLHELMGPEGLLLVFSRSADWRPYCRNQLVELQFSLENLKACGVNAASITYDSREILQRFAETYGIQYPMLSDVGSKVIRAFGILNRNVPEDHKMMYGMPWPGDYLITPEGIVRDKLFLRNYEHRPSATQLISHHYNGKSNSIEMKTDVLTATVSLSTDRCFPGQELGVVLEVDLKSGWHIYGDPLPANYQATRLTFEGPLIDQQSVEMPPAKPMLLKALGETLPVYEGKLRAVGKLGIKWSPPMPAKFLESLAHELSPDSIPSTVPSVSSRAVRKSAKCLCRPGFNCP